MKIKLTYLFLLLSVFAGCAHNTRHIIEKSIDKCQSINNGYYEMTKYLKLMSSIDTVVISQRCYFEKRDADSIYTFMFNSQFFSKTLGAFNLLYTGYNIISYTDSVGMKMSVANRSYDIKQIYVKNPAFSSYHPITEKYHYPFPDKQLLKTDDVVIKYIDKEEINGIVCFHINMKLNPNCDKSSLKDYVSRLEYDFWIDSENYVPLQFIISKWIKVNNEELNQYERYVLNEYQFNNLKDTSVFSQACIPSNVKLNNFMSLNGVELLDEGAIAPEWTLQSIDGHAVSLSDYKGMPVLLDFFYISCPPCIEIMPDLGYLHHKYSQSGLAFIGINSVRSGKKELVNFINQYRIKYPVVDGVKNVVNDKYKVSAYPTIYLIDKYGKIAFRHIGPLTEVDLERLEKTIRKSLL